MGSQQGLSFFVSLMDGEMRAGVGDTAASRGIWRSPMSRRSVCVKPQAVHPSWTDALALPCWGYPGPKGWLPLAPMETDSFYLCWKVFQEEAVRFAGPDESLPGRPRGLHARVQTQLWGRDWGAGWALLAAAPSGSPGGQAVVSPVTRLLLGAPGGRRQRQAQHERLVLSGHSWVASAAGKGPRRWGCAG